MKRLDEKEIITIEQFMEDEAFDSVDFMLASFKRLRMFCNEIKNEIWMLDNKGDLE